ncbi:hypothetical protein FNF29_01430 [Cafeteria roenbergensis]|uniref:TmcB/TmcC TPR repeats domain-containing protein n=1 Tax=Cafeteria roenbergensis TaxID=33653 RepID=A0A5A8CS97_CAFRO|nr:hypothetical protein FNF29_01430 [Cafeteria roenbergensis]|eukprot:KAA0156012.1 hypothetical protein FNF29_01430 [Cafeteria roenbergensis]
MAGSVATTSSAARMSGSSGVARSASAGCSLESVTRGIRRALFGLAYIASEERKASPTASNRRFAGAVLVDTLQLVAFSVNTSPNQPWGAFPIGSVISQGLAFLTPDSADITFGPVAFQVLLALAAAWAVIFVAMAAVIGCAFVQERKQSGLLLRSFRAVAALSTSALFLPISSLLFRAFACDAGSSATGGWLGTSMRCNDPVRVGVLVAIAIVLALFAVLAGFVTATFIDREPASSTWTARLHGRVDLAMLVLKLALTAVYNLSPADLVGDPVVTVALIVAGLAWYATIFRELYMINSAGNVIVGASAATFLWSAMVLGFAQLAPGSDQTAMLIAGGLLAALAGGVLVRQELERVASLPLAQLRSAAHILAWANYRVNLAEVISKEAQGTPAAAAIESLASKSKFKHISSDFASPASGSQVRLAARAAVGAARSKASSKNARRKRSAHGMQRPTGARGDASPPSSARRVAGARSKRRLSGGGAMLEDTVSAMGMPPGARHRRTPSSESQQQTPSTIGAAGGVGLAVSGVPRSRMSAAVRGAEADAAGGRGEQSQADGAETSAPLGMGRGARDAMTPEQLAATRAGLLDEAEKAYRAAMQGFDSSGVGLAAAAAFYRRFSPYNQQEIDALAKLKAMKPALDLDFVVFLRSLQLDGSASGSGNSPVDRVLYEQMSSSVRLLRVKAYRQLVRFWAYLSESTPDVWEVLQAGKALRSTVRELDSLFGKLLWYNPDSPSILRAYAGFLTEQGNEPGRAAEMLSRAERVEEVGASQHRAKVQHVVLFQKAPVPGARDTDSPETAVKRALADESAAVITLSSGSSNRGEIVSVSPAACRALLAPRASAIVGANVRAIIPSPWQEGHGRFLSGFGRSVHGRSAVLGRCLVMPVQLMDGSIAPFYMAFAEGPPDPASLQPRLAAVIQPVPSDEHLIVFGGAQDGFRIHSASRGSLDLLGLDGTTLAERHSTMLAFCPSAAPGFVPFAAAISESDEALLMRSNASLIHHARTLRSAMLARMEGASVGQGLRAVPSSASLLGNAMLAVPSVVEEHPAGASALLPVLPLTELTSTGLVPVDAVPGQPPVLLAGSVQRISVEGRDHFMLRWTPTNLSFPSGISRDGSTVRAEVLADEEDDDSAVDEGAITADASLLGGADGAASSTGVAASDDDDSSGLSGDAKGLPVGIAGGGAAAARAAQGDATDGAAEMDSFANAVSSAAGKPLLHPQPPASAQSGSDIGPVRSSSSEQRDRSFPHLAVQTSLTPTHHDSSKMRTPLSAAAVLPGRLRHMPGRRADAKAAPSPALRGIRRESMGVAGTPTAQRKVSIMEGQGQRRSSLAASGPPPARSRGFADASSVGSSGSSTVVSVMKSFTRLNGDLEPEVHRVRVVLALTAAALLAAAIAVAVYMPAVGQNVQDLSLGVQLSANRLQTMQEAWQAVQEIGRNATTQATNPEKLEREGVTPVEVELIWLNQAIDAMIETGKKLLTLGPSAGPRGNDFDLNHLIPITEPALAAGRPAGTSLLSVAEAESFMYAQFRTVATALPADLALDRVQYAIAVLSINADTYAEALAMSLDQRHADLAAVGPRLLLELLSAGAVFLFVVVLASLAVSVSAVRALGQRQEDTLTLMLAIPRQAASALRDRSTTNLEKAIAEGEEQVAEAEDASALGGGGGDGSTPARGATGLGGGAPLGDDDEMQRLIVEEAEAAERWSAVLRKVRRREARRQAGSGVKGRPHTDSSHFTCKSISRLLLPNLLVAAWLGTVVVATVLSQELALSQATRISRVAAASSAAVDAVQLAAGLIQTTNETFGTGGMALNDDAVAAQSWRDALHQGLPQRIDKLRRVTYRADNVSAAMRLLVFGGDVCSTAGVCESLPPLSGDTAPDARRLLLDNGCWNARATPFAYDCGVVGNGVMLEGLLTATARITALARQVARSVPVPPGRVYSLKTETNVESVAIMVSINSPHVQAALERARNELLARTSEIISSSTGFAVSFTWGFCACYVVLVTAWYWGSVKSLAEPLRESRELFRFVPGALLDAMPSLKTRLREMAADANAGRTGRTRQPKGASRTWAQWCARTCCSRSAKQAPRPPRVIVPAEASERASSLRDDSTAPPPESHHVTIAAMVPNTSDADTPASDARLLASNSQVGGLGDTADTLHDEGGDSGSDGGPGADGSQ